MSEPIFYSDHETDEANRKVAFIRDALPVEWLSYSEDLADAAETLWCVKENTLVIDCETQWNGRQILTKEFGPARSYVLLTGLALENVIKGLIIAHDPSMISAGTLHTSLKSHNLRSLADRVVGLDLSEGEKRLMEICQDAIPYWGRYPVPLRYADLQPKEAATPAFRDGFQCLHFKLCKLLYDRVKDGWDSGAGAKTSRIWIRRFEDDADSWKSST